MTTAKMQLRAWEKEDRALRKRRHEMTLSQYHRRLRALNDRMTPAMLREATREMYEAENKEPPREQHPKRRTSFRIFKDGGWVNASFDGNEVFVRPKTLGGVPRLAPERIAAIDTESLRVKKHRGRLTTVLVPFWFANGGEIVEPKKGTSILEQVADVLLTRFGVTHSEPDDDGKRRRLSESRTKQRAKRYRGPGRGLSRDGSRETVPLSLLVFFNLEYDIQRIFADRPELLRSIGAGADAVVLHISERIVIEVRRLILQNGAHFEWMIRDRVSGRVARVVGIDCWQYWKCSLAAAAKSFPGEVTPKVDIEDQIEGLFEKFYEDLTERERRLFHDYALGDVQTTFELYEATVTTLMQIDPAVLRKGGIIPPSAPSASIRIMQAKAWTCHPELKEYRRYPAWADRWGCRAYYGGRSFAIRPGVHEGLQVIDLVSAYAAALAGLPDPVTVAMEAVKPSRDFDVRAWRGLYGVLEVDGESTDDAAPPFRVHEDERLRYIAGKFERECLTIPEIVIGVLRGALRIDRIRGGVVMRRSKHNDRSYYLAGIREFFQLKESNTKGTPLYSVGKLLLNGGYGKLYECNRGDFPIPIAVKMPHFAEGDRIAESIALIYSRLGPLGGTDKPLGGVYWGENEAQKRQAYLYYSSELRAKPWMQGTARATAAVVAYVNALKRAKLRVEPVRDKQGRAVTSGEKLPDLSIRAFLRQHKRYSCGSHFAPLYASQITGLTSAKLGLMAACLDAHTVCGDTDSIAFKATVKIRTTEDLSKLEGFRRYNELLDEAGYPSPRLEHGKWVGVIAPGAGIDKLGSWELETPEPSVEALVVRPKVYSLRFSDGSFKQAFHSFAKYHSPEIDKILNAKYRSPEIDKILNDRTLSSDERAKRARLKRAELAKLKRAELLHEHMRDLIEQNATVEYDTRPSPTRLRQWILSNSRESPATFASRHIKVKRTPIPHTTETPDGVRWNKLTREERHARAEANARLTEEQRFAARRDDLGLPREVVGNRPVYAVGPKGQTKRIA